MVFIVRRGIWYLNWTTFHPDVRFTFNIVTSSLVSRRRNKEEWNWQTFSNIRTRTHAHKQTRRIVKLSYCGMFLSNRDKQTTYVGESDPSCLEVQLSSKYAWLSSVCRSVCPLWWRQCGPPESTIEASRRMHFPRSSFSHFSLLSFFSRIALGHD